MTTGISTMQGYAPKLTVGAGNPEALKYGRLWTMDAYRAHAPGEALAQVFLAHARPRAGATVIDFGCGTGRGGLMLAVLGGLKVTLVDFVRNCLDDDVRDMLTAQAHALRFVKADLEQPLPVAAEYGFCTDTLEHIPTDKVDAVLDHVLRAAQHVFFSISTVDDACGALIGETLHLTVRPFAWWLEQLTHRGCAIHWSQEVEGAALFYVSAWATGKDFVDTGVLNTEDVELVENVRVNVAGGWTQIVPHPTNTVDVMLLGGGPSLSAHEETIGRLRADGVKLVTLNGAYNWAIERGMTPSAQIMVDARAFNARFVRPVVDGCKYLISSQCHPDVLEARWVVELHAGQFVTPVDHRGVGLADAYLYASEAEAVDIARNAREGPLGELRWPDARVVKVQDELPRDRTLLWHTSTDTIADTLKAHYGEGGYYVVPGGSTVLLRAIPLLRMLGFRRFHLFGCDSCVTYERTPEHELVEAALVHHAYAQPENDGVIVVPVSVGGRIFHCTPWMVAQAQEFIDTIRILGEEIELEVYGDGLLAHILATGAALETEEAVR